MPAKKKSKSSRSSNHHESNAKAIVALLILLLAFGVYIIFNNYQENIMQSSQFQGFMLLTVLGFGLLIGLLYLIGKPQKN